MLAWLLICSRLGNYSSWQVLGGNGVCPEWCEDGLFQFPDPKPYGVNFPGNTFKITVVDMSGVKRVCHSHQMHFHCRGGSGASVDHRAGAGCNVCNVGVGFGAAVAYGVM